MLRTLGFAPTHRHVRKAVTRWRQGDINIVVNCEPEGFAHSYGTVHGASVCAIGLRVEDPAAALRRAHRLQVQSFSQPVGPGEYEIPALRAVGGSLIYLMPERETPSIWREEFAALPPDPTVRDAGLKRVDHFSQNMQYEEMLSWLLYYLTLFQVDKSAATEIADPVGLVQSQAIHSADRRLRILLNSSPAAQTLVGRFLHAYGGAGVQHISFATDDILATARHFVSSAWRRCPSPRTTTTTSALAMASTTPSCRAWPSTTSSTTKTQRGTYHHLYTRAFAKRFFFEVVQRREYDGYGARDTAIRLAAQSRFRNLAPGVDLAPLHPSGHRIERPIQRIVDGRFSGGVGWCSVASRKTSRDPEEVRMASRKKKASAKAGGREFANDAERSKADILAVATEEFATHGLSGARVDAIAERTRTSKRMIYYYFKGKEGLYRAVLEKAYSEIRSLDTQVGHRGCGACRSHSQDHRDHFRLRRDPSAFHQPGGRRERPSRPRTSPSSRRSSAGMPA